MPQITFKGIEIDLIKKESKSLVDDLVNLTSSPREYFSLQYENISFINDGEFDKGYPIINVYWFDRGQEMQDKVAEIITNHFSKYYEVIDVIFNIFEKERYYENGKHF